MRSGPSMMSVEGHQKTLASAGTPDMDESEDSGGPMRHPDRLAWSKHKHGGNALHHSHERHLTSLTHAHPSPLRQTVPWDPRHPFPPYPLRICHLPASTLLHAGHAWRHPTQALAPYYCLFYSEIVSLHRLLHVDKVSRFVRG